MLLQYDSPHLAGEMPGAEARWRWKLAPSSTTTEVTAPKVRPNLTVKSATFSEAASYAKALQGRTFDKKGGNVEVAHKVAKANRPPHIIRRGEALAPSCKVLEKTLTKGETLEQTHNSKITPTETCYFVVNKATEKVRDIDRMQWLRQDGCRQRRTGPRAGRREGRQGRHQGRAGARGAGSAGGGR